MINARLFGQYAQDLGRFQQECRVVRLATCVLDQVVRVARRPQVRALLSQRVQTFEQEGENFLSWLFVQQSN